MELMFGVRKVRNGDRERPVPWLYFLWGWDINADVWTISIRWGSPRVNIGWSSFRDVPEGSGTLSWAHDWTLERTRAWPRLRRAAQRYSHEAVALQQRDDARRACDWTTRQLEQAQAALSKVRAELRDERKPKAA